MKFKIIDEYVRDRLEEKELKDSDKAEQWLIIFGNYYSNMVYLVPEVVEK
jgi:hypothetical protein